MGWGRFITLSGRFMRCTDRRSFSWLGSTRSWSMTQVSSAMVDKAKLAPKSFVHVEPQPAPDPVGVQRRNAFGTDRTMRM